MGKQPVSHSVVIPVYNSSRRLAEYAERIDRTFRERIGADDLQHRPEDILRMIPHRAHDLVMAYFKEKKHPL